MDKDKKAELDPRKIISIDEGLVQSHLNTIVKDTVEETLNALLDAEADRLCNAKRYERTVERQDTRAGHYQRSVDPHGLARGTP